MQYTFGKRSVSCHLTLYRLHENRNNHTDWLASAMQGILYDVLSLRQMTVLRVHYLLITGITQRRCSLMQTRFWTICGITSRSLASMYSSTLMWGTFTVSATALHQTGFCMYLMTSMAMCMNAGMVFWFYLGYYGLSVIGTCFLGGGGGGGVARFCLLTWTLSYLITCRIVALFEDSSLVEWSLRVIVCKSIPFTLCGTSNNSQTTCKLEKQWKERSFENICVLPYIELMELWT